MHVTRPTLTVHVQMRCAEQTNCRHKNLTGCDSGSQTGRCAGHTTPPTVSREPHVASILVFPRSRFSRPAGRAPFPCHPRPGLSTRRLALSPTVFFAVPYGTAASHARAATVGRPPIIDDIARSALALILCPRHWHWRLTSPDAPPATRIARGGWIRSS
jgi:hypothetical protein